MTSAQARAVIDVAARVRGVAAGSVGDDTPLAELAPDSFDRVELLLAIEEECGLRLSVPPDAVAEIATVGELLRALQPVR